MGGANVGLVQPSTLEWSWFFENMAAPFSEDLNELFQGLVNDILDWAGSVYLGGADPDYVADIAEKFIEDYFIVYWSEQGAREK